MTGGLEDCHRDTEKDDIKERLALRNKSPGCLDLSRCSTPNVWQGPYQQTAWMSLISAAG